MTRTERDVMRGKRRVLYSQMVEPLLEQAHTRHERLVADEAFERTLRAARVYRHICSPYCLIHWAKRHDRRRFRNRVKTALRSGQWERAEVLHPKRLG